MNYLLLFCILLIIILSFIKKRENYSNQYTAVIVEPRQHKAMEFVLDNILNNLPKSWNIIIMHGSTNKEYIENIINVKLHRFKNRISMVDLKVENLTIPDYNALLKSKEFYDHIPTEIFLVFQTDSVICNKEMLDKYLKYDYVGAPWNDDNNVGNGGFSLRRKTKMLEILEKCPKEKHPHEDRFFSYSCVDIYKPSFEEAKEFSVETVYNNKSFAVHKSWAYLKPEELEKNINECKPLKTLIELNKN